MTPQRTEKTADDERWKADLDHLRAATHLLRDECHRKDLSDSVWWALEELKWHRYRLEAQRAEPETFLKDVVDASSTGPVA